MSESLRRDGWRLRTTNDTPADDTVLVVATPRVSVHTVTPYSLAILCQTLRARLVPDGDPGEVSLAVPVPGHFEEETRIHIAVALTRAALYNAGLRGWTVSVSD